MWNAAYSAMIKEGIRFLSTRAVLHVYNSFQQMKYNLWRLPPDKIQSSAFCFDLLSQMHMVYSLSISFLFCSEMSAGNVVQVFSFPAKAAEDKVRLWREFETIFLRAHFFVHPHGEQRHTEKGMSRSCSEVLYLVSRGETFFTDHIKNDKYGSENQKTEK